jgi:hypothetical protein
MTSTAWKSCAAGCALLLATLGPAGLIHAQTNPNGTAQNGTGQNGTKQNVNVAATPELDSLVLFGTGAAGVVGYALLRQRARRKS